MSVLSRLEKAAELALVWAGEVGDHVIGMGISGNQRWLAAASISGPVKVFAIDTGSCRHRLSGHPPGTLSLAWHPRLPVLASSGQDGKIRLWDGEEGQLLGAFPGGAGWVERAVWHGGGKWLASAAGRRVRMWRHEPAGGLSLWYESPEHASTVADLGWCPTGRKPLLASAAYGQMRFWQPDQSEPVRRFEWKGAVLKLVWSPDGRFVATGEQDATIHFWIARTGRDLQMWGYAQKVRELAWDAASRYLATGGGWRVTVWDCGGKGPAGSRPIELDVHPEPVAALAFHPRRPLLASGCGAGVIGLWSLGRRQLLGKAFLPAGISQLCWSADGGLLAVGTEVGSVAVFRNLDRERSEV